MLTLATSSGSRLTSARSGVSARFDFQPSRVQRRGEVDAGQTAGGRIERQVQAGADPHLEHRVAALEVELPDGGGAARGEDPVEDEVVDGGVQLVCALDLPLLQRRVHSEPSK